MWRFGGETRAGLALILHSPPILYERSRDITLAASPDALISPLQIMEQSALLKTSLSEAKPRTVHQEIKTSMLRCRALPHVRWYESIHSCHAPCVGVVG